MKVTRKTATVLNEPLEFFGVPRYVMAGILVLSGLVFRLAPWKASVVVCVGLSVLSKMVTRWDPDFFLLLPALVMFWVDRIYDPFEWEPFRLVIVEDSHETEND